jgi:hypothetical protein
LKNIMRIKASLATAVITAAKISRSQLAASQTLLSYCCTFGPRLACSCVHTLTYTVLLLLLLLLLLQPIGITEKLSKRWVPSQVHVSVKYIPVGSEQVRQAQAAAQHSIKLAIFAVIWPTAAAADMTVGSDEARQAHAAVQDTCNACAGAHFKVHVVKTSTSSTLATVLLA